MNSTKEPKRASQRFGSQNLQPVHLVMARKDVGAATVAELPFWGKPGWARFTRKVVLTAEKPSCLDALGVLLDAEWKEGELSCRIMAKPDNSGQLLQLAISASDTESHGDCECEQMVWAQEIVVDGAKAAARKRLVYHVYLASDPDGSVRRIADAFQGFE